MSIHSRWRSSLYSVTCYSYTVTNQHFLLLKTYHFPMNKFSTFNGLFFGIFAQLIRPDRAHWKLIILWRNPTDPTRPNPCPSLHKLLQDSVFVLNDRRPRPYILLFEYWSPLAVSHTLITVRILFWSGLAAAIIIVIAVSVGLCVAAIGILSIRR